MSTFDRIASALLRRSAELAAMAARRRVAGRAARWRDARLLWPDLTNRGS